MAAGVGMVALRALTGCGDDVWWIIDLDDEAIRTL